MVSGGAAQAQDQQAKEIADSARAASVADTVEKAQSLLDAAKEKIYDATSRRQRRRSRIL